MTIPLLSLTLLEYEEAVFAKFGKGKRHAGLIYSHWFREGSIPFDAPWIEKQAQSLVQEILACTDFSLPELSLQTRESGTIKFLLRYGDGLASESVVIPMRFGQTLCISSQVGCSMGCAFCETGKMGLIRHLKTEEIIAQVVVARFVLKEKIRNIVFMGMGEPFDNYDAVMKALGILTCERGLSFPPSKITVSTSGRVAEIDRFAKEAHPAVNLAVSLNAPNNQVRARLMPINATWNLEELKEAMKRYCLHPRREILIEYVMIDGINDSLENAQEVAVYLSGLRVKVNLIPYNPQSRGRWVAPCEEKMQAFRSVLEGHGFSVLLRTSKGRLVMAACGQLGNRNQKKKLYANSALPILEA